MKRKSECSLCHDQCSSIFQHTRDRPPGAPRGCGKTMLARETCETSGKGATCGASETGQTREEPHLSRSRFSRMPRASRVKDRITWDGVRSIDHTHPNNNRKGLTDPGAFDTSAGVVLTDCRALSPGAVLCSTQIPGHGLVGPS